MVIHLSNIRQRTLPFHRLDSPEQHCGVVVRIRKAAILSFNMEKIGNNMRMVKSWNLRMLSYTILLVVAGSFTSVQADGLHHHDHVASAQTTGDGVAQAISSSTNEGPSQPTSLPDLLRQFNIQVPGAERVNSGGYNYPSPPGTPPPSIVFPPQGGGIPALIPYFPIVEKVILIVGGGLLLLVFLACLKLGIEKGGILHALGSSLSNAVSGSDMGSVHASVEGSAGLSKNADFNLQQQQQVMNGVDRRF